MNNPEKKKKGLFMRRHAYLDDFQKTVTGEYVYMGTLHKLVHEKPMRKVIGAFIPFAFVIFAIIIACGCFRVAGMLSCPYVLWPYAISIFSSALALWAVIRLVYNGEPIRNYVYKATVPRFKICSFISMITCPVTLICDIVYVAINGFEGYKTGTIIFMILQLICALAAAHCYLTYRKLEWDICDSDTDIETSAY